MRHGSDGYGCGVGPGGGEPFRVNDLGIYIHVPFCKHACPYCDFYKLELRARPARARLDFPRAALGELDAAISEDPALASRDLRTIYFGGGTPSTLVPEAVGDLVAAIRARFADAADVEVTLEANPENLTEGRSAKWRAAGITRLSIGAQSFDAHELALLERLHAPEVIAEAVANARAAGFANIGLDLMFALPGQGVERWLANLARAVELAPEHVSFYGLTIHEGTPFHALHASGALALPDDDVQAEMYLAGCALLREAGFEHYEISNFARPGHRSRHNQRYWSRADVLGLGPGAHSNVGARRFANREDIDAWLAAGLAGALLRDAVEEADAETQAAEALFTGLRRAEGIAREDQPDWFARVRRWAESLPAESRAELLRETPDAVALTERGWLVSDAVIRAVLR